MFCSQCGKQIEDNAKFCKYCGKSLIQQNEPLRSPTIYYNEQMNSATMVHLDSKTIYAVLMIVSTIFAAMGGLLPSLSVSVWSYSKECSVKDIWKLASSLEDWGIEDVTFQAVLGVVSFAYILGAIAGAIMLVALLNGKKKYDLANPALVNSWSCIVADSIMIITCKVANNITADEFYGVKLFEIPLMGWLLLIVPLINIFIFVRGYLGENSVRKMSQSFQEENERIVEEKVCLVCKTRYTLGSKCPKCGSTAVEK